MPYRPLPLLAPNSIFPRSQTPATNLSFALATRYCHKPDRMPLSTGLVPNFNFTQTLRVGTAHLFSLGWFILIFGKTEPIRFEQFSLFVLKIRRRLQDPVFLVVMARRYRQHQADDQSTLDERYGHDVTVMMCGGGRYAAGYGRMCRLVLQLAEMRRGMIGAGDGI